MGGLKSSYDDFISAVDFFDPWDPCTAILMEEVCEPCKKNKNKTNFQSINFLADPCIIFLCLFFFFFLNQNLRALNPLIFSNEEQMIN